MKLLYQSGLWLLLMGILPTFTIACTNSKTPVNGAEESVSSTSSSLPPAGTSPASTPSDEKPSCGREVHRYGQGYDDEARSCLLDAYQAGRAASFIVTRYTIEGDPVTFTLRVISRSSIEVLEDNQDRFGARGVRTTMCSSLERGRVVNGHSEFVLQGCSGGIETLHIR